MLFYAVVVILDILFVGSYGLYCYLPILCDQVVVEATEVSISGYGWD